MTKTTSPGQRDTYDRRSFLGLGARAAAGAVVLGAGGTLLGACSQGTATGKSGGGGSPYGGVLTMATWAEQNSLSPPTAQWDSAGYLYANALYDTLVVIGADGKVHPYLAESVTPNPDYTVWTVKVRPGVIFHDGTPCDGAAVKMSLDAVKAGAVTGIALKPMTGTKLVDAMTVDILLDQPWVPFDAYLASQLGYIAAPAMLKMANQGASNPIGTGPFKFVNWRPNDHLTVERNPHYWQKGYPYLDQLTFRPTPDPSTRSDALESGAVQLIHTNYPPDVKTFLDKSNFRVIEGTPPPDSEPDVDFVMLNCDKTPTNDVDLRRALVQAINKEELLVTYGADITTPVSGPFQPGSSYYSSTPYPSYDAKAAAEGVAKYKAKTGSAPSIQLGTIPGPAYAQVLAILQQQWTAAGVNVSTTQIEQSAFITDAVFGSYQAVTFEQFSATDPDQNYVWWSTETYGPTGSVSLNLARNKDPIIQSALQEGRSNPDQEARIEAYKTVADRLAVDLPYIWLGKTLWAAISEPQVLGVTGQTLPDGTKSVGFADGVFLLHQVRLNGP